MRHQAPLAGSGSLAEGEVGESPHHGRRLMHAGIHLAMQIGGGPPAGTAARAQAPVGRAASER